MTPLEELNRPQMRKDLVKDTASRFSRGAFFLALVATATGISAVALSIIVNL